MNSLSTRHDAYALVWMVALVACDPTDRGPTADQQRAPVVVSAPSTAAPPYAVEVEPWEGPVGEEGYVIVSVVATDGHKINKEYPQRVQLEDGGKALELPLRRAEMSDAQLEGDHRLVFTLPATPKVAGEHRMKGKLKLSVCSGDQCRTATEILDARVTAQ